MTNATASHISELNLVTIPSSDQDRSITFYEALGFEKRTDTPFGDSYRWVEVYPPNGTAGIALAPPQHEDQLGTQTGIALRTDDIEAAHAYMKQRDVDVDADVSRMGDPIPPMFWFRDPDANVLLVVQTG